MRIELRLILWVTALAFLAMVIFRGFWHVPQLTLGNVVQAAMAAPQSTTGEIATNYGDALIDIVQLPEIDMTLGSMFDTDIDVAEPIVVDETKDAETAEVYLPILKGIIQRDDKFLAVFSPSPEGSSYTVVAVGDSFQGYRVRGIEGDAVTIQSSSNETVTFKLRGAGELP